MRAVLARRYGGPDVLELAELPEPTAGPGEVVVRLAAAGTNPVDAECRAGQAAAWFDDGPWVWGWDIAGVAAAVGAGVADFEVGDAVFGMPRFPQLARGYAELVAAPAAELAPAPRRIAPVTATALPLCGLTALQVLDRAAVGAGHHVLVNGAAGGVGHLAVQLAKARGARVTAVARTVKHDLVRELGADDVVDYTRVDVAATVAGVDAAVDCVGDDRLLATVRAAGVLAPVPGAARGPGALDAAAERAGVRVLRHVVAPDGAGLRRLAALVDEGRLDVHVAHALRLSDAVRAHELLDAGHGRGKIVLVP